MAFKIGSVIHFYVFPVIITLGLLGNALSAAVLFNQQRVSVSTYFYLLVLSIANSSMLLLGLYLRIRRNMTSPECQAAVFLFHAISLSCIYVTVFMTGDKCVAILWPLKARIYCTYTRARTTCIMFMVVNLLFNIPHAFNSKLVDNYCIAFPRQNQQGFFGVYIWMNFSLSCVIPFLLIMSCNCIIIQKLRQHRCVSAQQKTVPTEKISGVLLAVSFTMLLLTLPQYTRYVYYSIVDYHQSPRDYAHYILWYNITNKLFFTNHAIHFVLCYISGSQFRAELKRMVHCQKSKAQNSSSSVRLRLLDSTDRISQISNL